MPQDRRPAVASTTTVGLMLKASAILYQDLINENTVFRWSQAREPALTFLFNHYAMLLKVPHQNRPSVNKFNI